MSMHGYHDDYRTEAQRLRAARTVVGDAEARAARVMARLLGEHVVLQDDNSVPSTPDIRINFADGRLGYAEVIVDIDSAYAETWEQIVRRGFQILTARLSRDWFVTVDSNASLKLVERKLIPMLALFEADGLNQPWFASGPTRDSLRSLGVVEISSGERRPDSATGTLHISPEGASGPNDVPLQLFTEELDRLLSAPRFRDVWKKLAKAEADERHAFIGLSFATVWPVYRMLRYDARDMPDEPPRMPKPATHLWLMIMPAGWRCLHWSPTRGWLDAERHWKTP